jgi:hypothetical protein
MTDPVKWYRRRPFYGALFVAIVAVAIPVSQGIAGSGSSVNVPVERDNSICGGFFGHKVVGSAKFTRNKDGSPTVVYSITRGTPTGDYTLDVYAVDPCDFLASFGHFKIDSSGHGGKTVTVPASEVGGHKEFQTEGYNSGSGEFEESMVAKV